jgi:hypothetical protein
MRGAGGARGTSAVPRHLPKGRPEPGEIAPDRREGDTVVLPTLRLSEVLAGSDAARAHEKS